MFAITGPLMPSPRSPSWSIEKSEIGENRGGALKDGEGEKWETLKVWRRHGVGRAGEQVLWSAQRPRTRSDWTDEADRQVGLVEWLWHGFCHGLGVIPSLLHWRPSNTSLDFGSTLKTHLY